MWPGGRCRQNLPCAQVWAHGEIYLFAVCQDLWHTAKINLKTKKSKKSLPCVLDRNKGAQSHARSLSGLSHTLSLSGPSLPTAPPPPLPRPRLAGTAPTRRRPCASARPRPAAAAWRAMPSTCRSRPCLRSRASRRRCWSPREVLRRPSWPVGEPPATVSYA